MQKIIKYNPSFLAEGELINSFVVREKELELVTEVVKNNNNESNQHLLVIGARGSGKTTLLRRVRAEIHNLTELNEKWFPISFGEESYEIASAGQFWLEALYYLGVETGDSQWGKIYNELLKEPDDKRLEQRCLGQILEFANSQNKRIVLMIENLDLVLGEQLTDKDAWSLRSVLMAEKRIMLVASAVTTFDAVTRQSQAMYELFRVIELSKLSIEECQKVWRRVAKKEITREQARAVQILTGGNPRLLTILAVFGAKRSFNSLLEDLSLLVDDHTDYFKSNFEILPASERKVFACLASLWQDSTAAEVSTMARMTTSQVSALLKRLVQRGIVETIEGKKKRYQLSERLYNIYYLMRRGHENQRVHAVVNFMLAFYGKEHAHEALRDIADEICKTDKQNRKQLFVAFEYIMDLPEMQEHLKLGITLPDEFFEQLDLPDKILNKLELSDERMNELLTLYKVLAELLKNENWSELINTAKQALEIEVELELDFSIIAATSFLIGWTLLTRLNQSKEAIPHLEKSLELDSNNAECLYYLARAYLDESINISIAVKNLEQATRLNPTKAKYWSTLGVAKATRIEKDVLGNGRSEPNSQDIAIQLSTESLTAFEQAVELSPENYSYLVQLALPLAILNKDVSRAVLLINKALKIKDDEISNFAAIQVFARTDDYDTTLFHLNKFFELSGKWVEVEDTILPIMYKLANQGYHKELLQILENPKIAEQFEPLIVAIKMYLGSDVQAPQEVKEIAKDIIKVIKGKK